MTRASPRGLCTHPGLPPNMVASMESDFLHGGSESPKLNVVVEDGNFMDLFNVLALEVTHILLPGSSGRRRNRPTQIQGRGT